MHYLRFYGSRHKSFSTHGPFVTIKFQDSITGYLNGDNYKLGRIMVSAKGNVHYWCYRDDTIYEFMEIYEK